MSEAAQASNSKDNGEQQAAALPAAVQGGSDSKEEAAVSDTPEDEQKKYHEQMLYPTAGLRNYGFPDKFMIYTFKVCHLAPKGLPVPSR